MTMRPRFWREGEHFVWATGLALALILTLTIMLLSVVIMNGAGVFWPKRLALAELTDSSRVLGEIVREDHHPETGEQRLQFKIANRDLYGLDFRWLNRGEIKRLSYPAKAVALERLEHGNFFGSLAPTGAITSVGALRQALAGLGDQQEKVARLNGQLADLNGELAAIRLKQAKFAYRHQQDSPPARKLAIREQDIQARFTALADELSKERTALQTPTVQLLDANGTVKEIALADIVRVYTPNTMSWAAKVGYYATRLREFFGAEPRESNTEGGLFPAIFGTVMLVFLMSILSFPLGVIAGIYLREYAKDGILVKLVRIAVNNLAGIPSIVYGIFGLGFFVYGIGTQIDHFFFAERLPTPTFGTGGILWASLTLGLLTVPVVIVATEEALGAIPPGIREGSQALAATKFQTLSKLLLPMASPGILTGFILAMARAAGEVAPLMITGVVKLAPALPLDGHFPYLHLDRKFMHLGFHIYDIGFQSPNIEAAKPMVYVTTFLLICIVLAMTSTAIYLRNRMRKKYAVVDV